MVEGGGEITACEKNGLGHHKAAYAAARQESGNGLCVGPYRESGLPLHLGCVTCKPVLFFGSKILLAYNTLKRPFMPLQTVRRTLTLAALLGSLLSQASWAQTAPVRVGSKIDTEGALLGSIIVQVLEANGIKTENKIRLGNTKIVRSALLAGEIDIYPEYTGNGAFFFSDEKNDAWKSAEGGLALVRKLDATRNKIVWLDAAPANNTWAIALRKDIATTHKLKTLADLGRWVSAGGQFKLAASAEFIERSDALPAFQAAYGFKLKQDQLLSLAGGDTAGTIKAAAENTSGVNGAMAYGTDGSVSTMGLVILDDPKGIQPVYAPAPVVRQSVLAANPKIKVVLAPVFKALDSVTLQTLNAQVVLEGKDAKKVASDYLKAKGFIKG